MRRNDLWENVKTIIRIPKFTTGKSTMKVLPPLKSCKKPGPVRYLSKEEYYAQD